jgi:hypothetical protein
MWELGLEIEDYYLWAVILIDCSELSLLFVGGCKPIFFCSSNYTILYAQYGSNWNYSMNIIYELKCRRWHAWNVRGSCRGLSAESFVALCEDGTQLASKHQARLLVKGIGTHPYGSFGVHKFKMISSIMSCFIKLILS